MIISPEGKMADPRRHAFASDDWMLEQQMRAELEAEAWRRLRQQIAAPGPVITPEPASVRPVEAASIDIHKTGSLVLKAIVRFALAASGAYIAWLAAVDGGLGEFETWLALAAGFLVTLSLSMLAPARAFVHMLAEALRWGLLAAAGIGAVWLLTHNWS
jgi:hypothetical protein